jgi:TRAP-type mannitol/chloroaromatic compound transport system permease large subunit
MIELLSDNMAPIMFAALVVFLLLGYPVAFSLAFVGLAFGVVGIALGLFESNFFGVLPERMWGIVSNDTLLAVPFFTFMGLILERSGMAEDLLDTVGQMFGPVRGGLAYAVVFVGALLAATTGVVAASVIAMGLISLPIMLRYGYDRRLATGVIAASGTLAQIIPPSLVLIIMADQLGRSVGDMYAGALVPGLVLAGLYAGYVLLTTLVRPQFAPALPAESRTLGSGMASLLITLLVCIAAGLVFYDWLTGWPVAGDLLRGLGLLPAAEAADPAQTMQAAEVAAFFGAVLIAYAIALVNHHLKLGLLSRVAEQFIIVLIPPLALIFLVLGTIFIGLATPTEGGAMGAVGALLLALAKRRLSLDVLRQALESTAKLSAFVIFILIGARIFSLTFYGVDGHKWVEDLLVNLPGGQIGFLVVVNALVFVLAFFLDFFELAFIVVPLLGPAAEALGIDLIWFGVLLGINMQTSFMHPPFGFALFYLRSVAPRERYRDKLTDRVMEPVTTGQIYWGAVPFVCIQIIMVLLAIGFPEMVMHYKGEVATGEDVQIEIPPPPTGEPGSGDLSQPPEIDLSQPPEINP